MVLVVLVLVRLSMLLSISISTLHSPSLMRFQRSQLSQTFEASNMLDAIFGSMNAGAVVGVDVAKLIISVEPFAALERRRCVGRVASITPDRVCYVNS